MEKKKWEGKRMCKISWAEGWGPRQGRSPALGLSLCLLSPPHNNNRLGIGGYLICNKSYKLCIFFFIWWLQYKNVRESLSLLPFAEDIPYMSIKHFFQYQLAISYHISVYQWIQQTRKFCTLTLYNKKDYYINKYTYFSYHSYITPSLYKKLLAVKYHLVSKLIWLVICCHSSYSSINYCLRICSRLQSKKIYNYIPHISNNKVYPKYNKSTWINLVSFGFMEVILIILTSFIHFWAVLSLKIIEKIDKESFKIMKTHQ